METKINKILTTFAKWNKQINRRIILIAPIKISALKPLSDQRKINKPKFQSTKDFIIKIITRTGNSKTKKKESKNKNKSSKNVLFNLV